MAILKSDLDGLMGLDGARLVIMRSPFQTDDGADAVGPVPTVPILTMMSATLQKRVAYGPTFPGNDVPPTVRGGPVRTRPSSHLDLHGKYILNETNNNLDTVPSRYKRIVYKRIWVASLAFQSVYAAYIHIELNQLSLVTRTHCNNSASEETALLADA